MPYIKQEERDYWNQRLEELEDSLTVNDCVTEGELNYLITKLCLAFVQGKGIKYSNYNAVMGVLESAKQEFYRREIADYEEEKAEQNGDVY